MQKILVIEDEHPLRETLVQMLQFEDFEVLEAADGRAGLQQAQTHLPDLIITDIMMPELDGYQVLETLSAAPETSTIPAIVISAHLNLRPKHDEHGSANIRFIAKPFDFSNLLTAINEMLG